MTAGDRRGWTQRARNTILGVATLCWATTTFLPLISSRVPAVPEIGPAYIAFLGACLAVPEVTEHLRRNRKDDDE